MATLNLISKFRSTRGGDPTLPAYLAGHVLTEAIRKGQPGTPAWPDKIELERTADDQRQSALMRLPIEVRRRIYELVFEEAGLAQHIYVKDGRYTHTTCITDHEGPDERQTEIKKKHPLPVRCLKDRVWSRRLLSSWANHWRCEEAAMALAEGSPTPTPFLSLLLCCKRVYLDCRPLLYESLTFVFHRVETAIDVLSTAPFAPEIKYLQISLHLYICAWDDLPPKLPWQVTDGAWQQLRALLSELESLQRVSIWLDGGTRRIHRNPLYKKDTDTLDFDTRLHPNLRVSIPVSEKTYGRAGSKPAAYEQSFIVRRGYEEFWQEPDEVPGIAWYPNDRTVRVYRTADGEYTYAYVHVCSIFPSFRDFFRGI